MALPTFWQFLLVHSSGHTDHHRLLQVNQPLCDTLQVNELLWYDPN